MHMGTVLDQQPSFKHYCKICKRGFGCGRALGGHMRAHGIGDENGHINDEDPVSDSEDKLGGKSPPGNKRMYALRTNPNRLKSCRICENCGKEFSSWKSFLEHGKCSTTDVESLISLARSDDEDGATPRGYGWSKGKRSRRAKLGSSTSNCPSSEEEDLAANCLVMLSTARVDPLVVETEESCASASKEDERQNTMRTMPPVVNRTPNDKAKVIGKGMFECKACKKVFNSHQALGGHRASHKKVKGCFAAKLDDLDESVVEEDVITNDDYSFLSKPVSILPLETSSQPPLPTPSKKKSKVHECTICHRIFLSGQALGGHKRCHWLTSNSPDTSSIAKFHQLQDHSQHFYQKPQFDKSEPLDLNLPAPSDNTCGPRQNHHNSLTFEVPPEVYVQPWINLHANDDNIENKNHDNHGNTTKTSFNASMPNMEDGTDSKVKLAKLSDLKDLKIGTSSSPWLQVGIGSTSNVGNETKGFI